MCLRTGCSAKNRHRNDHMVLSPLYNRIDTLYPYWAVNGKEQIITIGCWLKKYSNVGFFNYVMWKSKIGFKSWLLWGSVDIVAGNRNQIIDRMDDDENKLGISLYVKKAIRIS